MNEPDIPFAHAPVPCAPGLAGRDGAVCATPASACYAYAAWPRYPVIGPVLLVVVAVLSALLLVSNANAFNDVNAEIQITSREQRVARQQAAERVAQAEAAGRAMVAEAGTARPRPASEKRK